MIAWRAPNETKNVERLSTGQIAVLLTEYREQIGSICVVESIDEYIHAWITDEKYRGGEAESGSRFIHGLSIVGPCH